MQRSRHLIPALHVLVLLATMLWSPLAAAAAGVDYERWFTLEMAGQRAGYMHAVQKTEGDRITTNTRIVLGLGRGDAAVSVSMEGSFVETLDGKPVSMQSTQKLGAIPVTTHYAFTERNIEIVSTQGEQVTKSERPLPQEGWLTPAAAGEYLRKRLEAGAEQIVVRTVDPLSGPEPATITRKAIRKSTIEAMGKTVSGYQVVSTSSSAPTIESTEFIDEQGIPVRSQASMGGIAVKITAATKEVAMAKTQGPEMLVRTFVAPDRPIARAREVRRAVYVISTPSGKAPELPQTSVQTVEEAGQRAVKVTIDTRQARPAEAGDVEDPAYRAASPMANSEDPVIQGLVRAATEGAGASKAERAEAMREFVRTYVGQKDLGVGFASASEVARNRQGDCTEHATLLTAMLRADGIPSRVASGLIYADQFAGDQDIFAYHMWTQALLEHEGAPVWIDLDATLPAATIDATHITLATSPLSDGEATSALTNLISVIGRLKIKVESTEP